MLNVFKVKYNIVKYVLDEVLFGMINYNFL